MYSYPASLVIMHTCTTYNMAKNLVFQKKEKKIKLSIGKSRYLEIKQIKTIIVLFNEAQIVG